MILKGKLASSLYFKQRWKNGVNEWGLRVNKMGRWTWFWLFLLLETRVWALTYELKNTHIHTNGFDCSCCWNKCLGSLMTVVSKWVVTLVRILCQMWVVVESNTVTDHFCNKICCKSGLPWESEFSQVFSAVLATGCGCEPGLCFTSPYECLAYGHCVSSVFACHS